MFAGTRVFDPADIRGIEVVDYRGPNYGGFVSLNQDVYDCDDDRNFRNFRKMMLDNKGVRI
jgi:hypothetical protein